MKDLNNTWCEATEEKPKNNFKDYGFEADFEGIIYEKYITPCNQTFFNGAIWFRPKDDYHYMKPVSWTDKGSTIHYHVQEHYLTSYNLIPIKKEWYENPDNVGKLIVYDYFDDNRIGIFKCLHKDKGWIELYTLNGCKVDQKTHKVRPATKEEVLALLVKE